MKFEFWLKRVGAVIGIVSGVNLIISGSPEVGVAVIGASLGSAGAVTNVRGA